MSFSKEKFSYPAKVLSTLLVAGTLTACAAAKDSGSDIDLGSVDCKNGPTRIEMTTDLPIGQELRIGEEVSIRGAGEYGIQLYDGKTNLSLNGAPIEVFFNVKGGIEPVLGARVIAQSGYPGSNLSKVTVQVFCGKG